jgi:intracellular sulfur oxidation DsrE/DsrF family protein
MRQIAVLITTLVLASVSFGARAAQHPDDFWTTPAIAGYGRMHPLPQAAYKPDPGQTYRIVFALTAAPKSPGDVNPALERVARTVNLYVASGVPLSHLKFVAVAYGPATALALNNTQYKAANGMANPNLPLIAILRKAGVDVAVCGQAVAEHDFQYDWIDPSVTLALSALTTITSLEQAGYHLMPL